MISEVLLLLAGHSSSLFPTDHTLNKDIASLLHPGEAQCLQSLGLIAFRYRKVKNSCVKLQKSPSRYICALCASLSQILKNEYEALVVETEARILKRDPLLVANGAFVPLSSVRAIFSEWDAPLAALSTLMDDLLSPDTAWKAGALIDMLLVRSKTGVHRVANIFSQLSTAVQAVWRSHLTALVVHGSLSTVESLATKDYTLIESSFPTCISPQSRELIAYIGRAIGTIKAVKWQKQPPRSLATEHTLMLESVLPADQHAFDTVVSQIRVDVGEWLWHNVLTKKDIDEAVDSLGNYFLLRNGEFCLSLIREIERLKISRLTNRSGTASLIREQDLNLALLRASLGTSAQHDPCLARIRFQLPTGPLRPLLPSLTHLNKHPSQSVSFSNGIPFDSSLFNAQLLGTPLSLLYNIEWPLDLFLGRAELTAYGTLFSFLSALRKTHTRVHDCWSSLSDAQRARRRWTGLGEGGTPEEVEGRKKLLRRGWGTVRDMGWFLDTLLGYVMMDVVELEFQNLKGMLSKEATTTEQTPAKPPASPTNQTLPQSHGTNSKPNATLDFTSLRAIHSNYIDRLLHGCLLTNPGLSAILQSILDTCERFAAQVERWGGDVLPALLFEGSLHSGEGVGAMAKERWGVVADIDETLRNLLETFYEQLNASISQQPFTNGHDTTKSLYVSMANRSAVNMSRIDKNMEDSRRHVERLLLRLDFNGGLSKPRNNGSAEILSGLS